MIRDSVKLLLQFSLANYLILSRKTRCYQLVLHCSQQSFNYILRSQKKLELNFERLLNSKGIMGKWLLVAGTEGKEGAVWVHGEMVN